MVKPVVGEVVVIPFPRIDSTVGKRRPALVIAINLFALNAYRSMLFSQRHQESKL